MKTIKHLAHLTYVAQIVFFLLANAVLVPAYADRKLQDHASINEIATNFILDYHQDVSKIDVSVNRLDERLKLSECMQELNVYWPPGAVMHGRTSVGIECQDEAGWRVFLRARIDIYDHVAVLSKPVLANEVVSADNLKLVLQKKSGAGIVHISDVESVTGYQYKRSYSSGRPLTQSMLAAPQLVKKGNMVSIVYGTDGISVRMKGVALSNGKKGAVIPVRNVSSERVVHAEVISKGRVKVIR